jgi:rSAM/selenodomain-associated transferase 1
LGDQGAADLYRRLARRCLASAKQAAVAPVELWCTPDTDHPFFRDCSRDFGVSLHMQQGEDLGQRMFRALAQGLPALIMGSDCISLSAADLREAAAALELGADAVLGPAEDGGYVLLGLARASPALFDGIAWGSDQVLGDTRTRLRQLGWCWYELPVRWDVDRPEDLARLRACDVLS